VIHTALALDPAKRFASAAAMIDALERVAVAEGWIGGPGAIQRLMQGLFGEVPEPRAMPPDDAPVTGPHSIASSITSTVASLPLLAEPTRPARRLARGTERSCQGTERDDLDERTRGRRPLRRLAGPRLAA